MLQRLRENGTRGSVALAVVTLATACSVAPPEDPESAAWQGSTTQTEAGSTVRTTAGSVWGSDRTLEAALTIGRESGPLEYLLGHVTSVVPAPLENAVLVVDAQVPAVRVYHADTGEYLRDVGRSGQGPGEYEMPDAVAVDGRGAVFVRDLKGRQVTVFEPDGRYRESFPLERLPRPGLRLVVSRDGQLFDPTFTDAGTPAVTSKPAGELLSPPHSELALRAQTVFVDASPAMTVPIPYGPDYHWAVSSRGDLVGGYGDAYRFWWRDPAGALMAVEKAWDPVPIPDIESAYVDRYTLGWIRYPTNRGYRWNGPDTPAYKPAFMGFLFSEDAEQLWVVRAIEGRRTERECDESPELGDHRPGLPCWPLVWVADVFGRDGRFLGTVRPTPDVRVFAGYESIRLTSISVHGDEVFSLAALSDTSETHVVRRYRLVEDVAAR